MTWKTYGGLWVGLAGRRTLIALKLFAAVDHDPQSVHVQDLIALAPTDDELEEAAEWTRKQDESSAFKEMVSEVVTYVQRNAS